LKVRLTVLGASPSCPNPGAACSGYLIAENGTMVLLDCGSGVIANLQQHMDFRRLDAVVISHMHADHFIDLIPLRYGLRYAPGERRDSKLPLYLPEGGQWILQHVMNPIDSNPEFFTSIFEITECQADVPQQIASLELDVSPVCHFISANGIAIRGEKRLAFSGDSGPCSEVAEVAKNADCFLCEATLPEDYNAEEGWGHLKASEAAKIARAAGAKMLVLTHMWEMPEIPQSVAAAEAEFDGPVVLAKEHMIIEV
jgi:ribonuclease BN (tRNA processing enzyme)